VTANNEKDLKKAPNSIQNALIKRLVVDQNLNSLENKGTGSIYVLILILFKMVGEMLLI
jgi:hypothetical protein